MIFTILDLKNRPLDPKKVPGIVYGPLNVAVAVGRPRQRVRENGGRVKGTRARETVSGGRAGAVDGRVWRTGGVGAVVDGVRPRRGSGAIDPTSVTMATVPNKSSATLQPPAARRPSGARAVPAKAACSAEFSRLKRPGRVRNGRVLCAENSPAGPRATVLAAPVDRAQTPAVRVHPLRTVRGRRVDRKSPTNADGERVFEKSRFFILAPKSARHYRVANVRRFLFP